MVSATATAPPEESESNLWSAFSRRHMHTRPGVSGVCVRVTKMGAVVHISAQLQAPRQPYTMSQTQPATSTACVTSSTLKRDGSGLQRHTKTHESDSPACLDAVYPVSLAGTTPFTASTTQSMFPASLVISQNLVLIRYLGTWEGVKWGGLDHMSHESTSTPKKHSH